MTTHIAAPALSVTGLRKTYPHGFLGRRRKVALEGLDLAVPRGAIFGCLGPNGSGKTTTLRIVLGLCRPDAGRVSVLGHASEDAAWRRRVGYLPEQPYVYDYLTCREYLDYVGRLHGLQVSERRRRAEGLLARVDLLAAADQRMRTYSKGMQQRAALAQALMGDPELVFLDEPMSGLDPLGRRLVRELILDLRREGRTVFFSTHILADAETLCDQVALLSRGRLLAVGALDAILKVQVEHLDMLVTGVAREQLEALPEGSRLVHDLGERLSLAVPERSLGQAVTLVERLGGKVLHVQPVRQSLEDYFVREVAPVAGRAS